MTRLTLSLSRRSGRLGLARYSVRRALEVGLLLSGLALWAMNNSTVGKPVAVFPVEMDADCIRDAKATLEREGLHFRVAPSEDGIWVSPDDRARVQLALALAGLPRHRVPIRTDWGCGGGGPTDELLIRRAQKAEAILGQAVSIVPGVQRATVKIKRAADAAFAESPKPNLIQVRLRLGAALPPSSLAAVARLALISFYDIRNPVQVQIRDDSSGRLLGTAQFDYSTGPRRDWENF